MGQKRAPDERIAEVAGRQHGAVSIRQLRAAGLGDSAVRKRCRAGRLHRLHRGVYAVGHIAPSDERRWIAAVLAMGEGTGDDLTGSDGAPGRNAALSHRSAAELFGLLPPRGGPVDVSLSGRSGRRKRPGIRIHRPASLEPAEITRKRGILVTSPARTLADLRRLVPPGVLRRAIRQADFLGLEIGSGVTADRTRSELERRFLHLCRRNRLPNPAVNHRIGRMTVDFCWVEQRLIVETDGYRTHRGQTAFEDDRARDLRLHSWGYQVLHLSSRQVVDEPEWVAAVLRETFKPLGRVSDPMEQ